MTHLKFDPTDRVKHKAVRFDPSRNSSLSFKAKGILYYLLLKPSEWEGHLYDLVQNSTDGEKSVRSGIKELIDAGYMKRMFVKEDGKFKGSYYIFSDIPKYKKQ
jgi:hypothetical protein